MHALMCARPLCVTNVNLFLQVCMQKEPICLYYTTFPTPAPPARLADSPHTPTQHGSAAPMSLDFAKYAGSRVWNGTLYANSTLCRRLFSQVWCRVLKPMNRTSEIAAMIVNQRCLSYLKCSHLFHSHII